MSGRESKHIVFQKITVFAVFSFLLLQTGVFIWRAVVYVPSGVEEPAPAEPEIIHDTVYVYRDRMPGGKALPPASRNYSVREAAVPAMPEQKPLPSKGDSEWKWNVVELNSADSAALDDLPGIGGYYAKQILRYRARLGSFVSPEQLLEIQGIDSARFARLSPRVRVDVSSVRWIDLKTVSEEELAAHPYVGRMAARGMIRFRESVPPESFTLEALVDNGILSGEAAARLGRYVK